jgi:hypothetical protein
VENVIAVAANNKDNKKLVQFLKTPRVFARLLHYVGADAVPASQVESGTLTC